MKSEKVAEMTYDHEGCHGTAAGLGVTVDICEDTGHDSDGRAGEYAGEEAEEEKCRPVGCEGAGHGPDGEHDKGDNGQHSPAEMLAERCPDYRSEDVADEEDGDGQDLLLLVCDAPFGGYEGDGVGWEGRAHCAINDLHHG